MDFVERWQIQTVLESSESAITLYFSGQDLKQQNENVSRFTQTALNNKKAWVTDIIPSFDSVVLCFDPLKVDNYAVYAWLNHLVPSDIGISQGELHKILVNYNQTSEFDLIYLSDYLNLSVSDIVDLHCQTILNVLAIGFAPHFAYLGENDPQLTCPRRQSPRSRVPKGAVALADTFSAVYPSESPGGWQLLGQTVDPDIASSIDFKVGDQVQFVAKRILK